jgi:hypothetical protein
MPNNADFSFFEGEDFTQPFEIRQADGTTDQNISGWTIVLTVKDHFSSGTVRVVKTATVTSAAEGLCQVTFARADTSSLTPRVYAYDLSRTDSGGNTCLVWGYLTLRDRSY